MQADWVNFERGPAALPLALYIHTPWCLRKCPYCDFNSHPVGAVPPFAEYVTRLLADLDHELQDPAARRPLTSVFIGGGTPSLFPGEAIQSLLDGVRGRVELAPDCEITLEANPGATDAARLAAYRRAGVNRLSIGVQSLDGAMLTRLGRIHDPDGARAAVAAARAAGYDNLNLDLMFALPDQSLARARVDLESLIALAPEHISYYQLTLEPNTAFHTTPPPLPDEDLTADIAAAGLERLGEAGYRQYEVSAFAQTGRQCRHNLNYWRFGDYLGIGAGAHGKLTDPWHGDIRRTAKHRHPVAYLGAAPNALTSEARQLTDDDRVFEFALNAFRLTDGFDRGLFTDTTGLPWSRIDAILAAAVTDGLLRTTAARVEPTQRGRDFADVLVARFIV
ncbi:MAG TPA: radical SAM family heme chaperone HemW [Lamprocystis sp. (in: g-proteobacteria)]|nr:radical SAM family heme chaperone HemW [Lamprocystis sp. (in: g-proteobacteria)]